jgi:hypothetical protein
MGNFQKCIFFKKNYFFQPVEIERGSVQDQVGEGEGRRGLGSLDAAPERDREVDLRKVELVLHRELELHGRQQEVGVDHGPERNRALAGLLKSEVAFCNCFILSSVNTHTLLSWLL